MNQGLAVIDRPDIATARCKLVAALNGLDAAEYNRIPFDVAIDSANRLVAAALDDLRT